MHAYLNLNVLKLFMMWSLFVNSHSFLKNSQRFIFFFLLEGFKSEHSNSKEDRKFSFQFSSWEGLMLTTNRKDDCHWYKTTQTEDFELVSWHQETKNSFVYQFLLLMYVLAENNSAIPWDRKIGKIVLNSMRQYEYQSKFASISHPSGQFS